MIIAFDDHCLLCNGFVRFLLRRDARGLLRFAGVASVSGARMFSETGQDVADPAAIVFDTEQRRYLASEAVLRLVAAWGGAGPDLRQDVVPFPLAIRIEMRT